MLVFTYLLFGQGFESFCLISDFSISLMLQPSFSFLLCNENSNKGLQLNFKNFLINSNAKSCEIDCSHT